MKQLGADYVFDYGDADVVNKIKNVGQIKFALDTIATPETFQKSTTQQRGLKKYLLIP